MNNLQSPRVPGDCMKIKLVRANEISIFSNFVFQFFQMSFVLNLVQFGPIYSRYIRNLAQFFFVNPREHEFWILKALFFSKTGSPRVRVLDPYK